MKLLIVTQVMDSEHPILGFFHRWVEEFSEHCEQVHVICLQEGKHNLPSNITVHSLGKDEGKGRLTYLWRFYKLIWQLRHDYDNVFVHMNQIYVILGAPFWRALGKKVGFWYAHGTVSYSLKIAEKFTNKTFTCSKESFRLESKKVLITGHGIDTVKFYPKTVPKDLDLITVGRITESKNLIALLYILKEVQRAQRTTLTIVGISETEEEKKYENVLHKKISELGLTELVNFVGKVSQINLPSYLNRAKLFVTAAQNGSLDKAILEAIACGLPIVSTAPGSASLPLGAAQVTNQADFVSEVQKVLESEVSIINDYQQFVVKNHSIGSLIPKILNSL